MKCSVSPSALSAALSLVSRAVSPRSTLPVLGNVLLETTSDGLRVTATNLDLTMAATVPAEVALDGRTTVPARLLSEYVASLAEAPCSLELDVNTQVLRLSCGVHRTNLHGIDAVEFPPLPARDGDAAIELDAAVFANAVSQTAMAASGDEASPVLTGVLFQVEGERLTLAATDRHRLAVKTLEAKSSGEKAFSGSVIVPSRHLSEVARAVNPSRPTVSISFSEQRNQVFFALKDALLREAKTASVLARDAANPVRLRVGDNTLTLVAQTAEVGDDEAPLSANVKGDDVQIAFNARYVLDALSVMDSDEVQLSFNGALQPGVIRPSGRDDYLCIIMPVRVP
jgi:DNA polymerase-3 subunit beta